MSYLEAYTALKDAVDSALEDFFDQLHAQWPEQLVEAMRYSVIGGGKRLRAVLLLEFCRICGGEISQAMPVACAVELLHAYSLIHDDLPCMDDDDFRRGKESCHKKYGEMTAVLAGDALQAEAFRAILSSGTETDRLFECARMLSEAAGVSGICRGQYLDMAAEGRRASEQEMFEIHAYKTSSMFIAACSMGILMAGGTKNQQSAARVFAENLGIAFQIRDDMLDVLGTEAETGKPVGSDSASDKSTFMTLYGETRCRELVEEYSVKAKYSLEGMFTDTGFLPGLVDGLRERLS